MQKTGHSYCITLVIIQSHEIMYVGVCKLWAHQIPPQKTHIYVTLGLQRCRWLSDYTDILSTLRGWSTGNDHKNTLPRTWVLAIRAPREWSSERGGRSLCVLPSSHQITHQAKIKKTCMAVREAAWGERVIQSGTVPIRYDSADSPFWFICRSEPLWSKVKTSSVSVPVFFKAEMMSRPDMMSLRQEKSSCLPNGKTLGHL